MADNTDAPDRSLELLDLLRAPAVTEEARHRAFEEMLELDRGWWGPYPLFRLVSAWALGTARIHAQQMNLPADAIDWESIATESLLTLYMNAASIHTTPGSWLRGVIRNHVLDEIRHYYAELAAERETESGLAADTTDAESAGTSPETTDLVLRLIGAIQVLPPALRDVARLLFLEQRRRIDIAKELGLSSDTLRKRISRIRQHLQDEFKKPTGASRRGAPSDDPHERESLMNLMEAVATISRTGRTIPAAVVIEKWTDWQQEQQAHHEAAATSGDRSVGDWIRVLMPDSESRD